MTAFASFIVMLLNLIIVIVKCLKNISANFWQSMVLFLDKLLVNRLKRSLWSLLVANGVVLDLIIYKAMKKLEGLRNYILKSGLFNI